MTTYRNKALRRLADVIAGADAGAYTLPTRLHDLTGALERVTVERARVARLPEGYRHADLNDEIRQAAVTGKTFPGADKLADAERHRQTQALYGTALDLVAEGLEDQLETAFTALADEIITDHLAPALTEVMAELTDVAKQLKPHGTDHAGLLEAPETARKARVTLDVLAHRYTALRNARNILVTTIHPGQHPGDRFSVVRNFTALAAGYRPGVAPWPTVSTAETLIWFVDHAAQVWLPTIAQADALHTAETEASNKAAA